jgi:hypothetical protein
MASSASAMDGDNFHTPYLKQVGATYCCRCFLFCHLVVVPVRSLPIPVRFKGLQPRRIGIALLLEFPSVSVPKPIA